MNNAHDQPMPGGHPGRGTALALSRRAALIPEMSAELATPDLAHYEARVLQLARDPLSRAALRERLAGAHRSAPLFDTPRFVEQFQDILKRIAAGRDPGAATTA